ncbi:MAG: DUF2812 domain-containing protein, partial [Erysipelotrichaceae bacterium]|nr:DUF2812 domain-containing protein [Erysipelotrichaceae bacterium]
IKKPLQAFLKLCLFPFDCRYGAEYIGRILQWIYFRKKSKPGRFDIFSDLDSKIAHLGRIHKTVLTLGFANLLIGIANLLICDSNSFTAVMNLLVATLLMYGVGRLQVKIEYLENERSLIE